MKLKTSLINKTVLRKDILRYSPIWAFYSLFLLLILFGMGENSRYSNARNVVDFMPAMTWINLFYGGICGVVLFTDLFNNRLCNALHAFPLRREGWLTTHILSGFLFGFVLPFGLAFELPVALYVTTKMGLTNYAMMASKRKFVILAVVVIAAFLTPPDVVSQIMLSIPILILFEISLLICKVVKPKEQAAE